MSDHEGLCRCPILRATAEISRMLTVGVQRGETYSQAGTRALLIGRLRQAHGCRGVTARDGLCPWSAAIAYAVDDLAPDERVPLLGRNPQGKATGQYL